MKVLITIGRIEGFASSIGLSVNGLPFLYRGPAGIPNLAFGTNADRLRAVAVLREFCAVLRSAGVQVEGLERLDEED